MFSVQDLNLILQLILQYNECSLHIFQLHVLFEGYISSIHICIIKNIINIYVHCKENPVYAFLFWELHSLSPNFHIHVSASDLYIPRIGPHISLQKNMQTDPVNI